MDKQLPKETYASYTFYFLCAMLKISKRHIQELKESGAARFATANALTNISNRITDFEKLMKNSIPDSHFAAFNKEFTDREYEAIGQVVFAMVDMNEKQRLMLEQMVMQMRDGNVSVMLQEEPQAERSVATNDDKENKVD